MNHLALLETLTRLKIVGDRNPFENRNPFEDLNRFPKVPSLRCATLSLQLLPVVFEARNVLFILVKPYGFMILHLKLLLKSLSIPFFFYSKNKTFCKTLVAFEGVLDIYHDVSNRPQNLWHMQNTQTYFCN